MNDWYAGPVRERGLGSDLPSGTAAKALVKGEPGALGPVIGYTLLRSVLIGAGLYAAGQRQQLVKSAVSASVAIELFVLWWAANND